MWVFFQEKHRFLNLLPVCRTTSVMPWCTKFSKADYLNLPQLWWKELLMFPHIVHKRERKNGSLSLDKNWHIRGKFFGFKVDPKLYLPIAGPRPKSTQLESSPGLAGAFSRALCKLSALLTQTCPGLYFTLPDYKRHLHCQTNSDCVVFSNRNCNSGGFELSPVDSTGLRLNVCGSLWEFSQQVTPHCHSNFSESLQLFGRLIWAIQETFHSWHSFSSVPLPVKTFINQQLPENV